jgi:hypothetical protein
MKHRNQQPKAQTSHESSHQPPPAQPPTILRTTRIPGRSGQWPQPRFQLRPRSDHGGLITHQHMQARIPLDHGKHGLRLFLPPVIQPTGTQQSRRLGHTHGTAGCLISAGG